MKLRSEGLTWREIDGETVILDLLSSTYLKTNATGTVLLKELTQRRTRDELVSALAAAYDISEQQAGTDTDAFLELLRQKNLLADK